MDTKTKSYESATKRIIEESRKFEGYVSGSYSLPAIVYAIRILMQDKNIRQQFIGKDYERFSQGFCALNSNAIYNLTGGGKAWEYYVISKTKYPKGPVAYLRNKLNGAFLYLGDLTDVPYDQGHAIDAKQLRGSPNVETYIKKIKQIIEY